MQNNYLNVHRNKLNIQYEKLNEGFQIENA